MLIIYYDMNCQEEEGFNLNISWVKFYKNIEKII